MDRNKAEPIGGCEFIDEGIVVVEREKLMLVGFRLANAEMRIKGHILGGQIAIFKLLQILSLRFICLHWLMLVDIKVITLANLYK